MTDTIVIHIYGKPVTLTGETIDDTWKWFANHERGCARAATAGEFFVNNLASYVERCERQAKLYDQHDNGGRRLSLTFIQRAYFIQTGQSVPVLAPA